MGMKPFKMDKEWVTKQITPACPVAVRKFFRRWPNGLTLTRRNLYMVAKEYPLSYLMWFTYVVSEPRHWFELAMLAEASQFGYVISPAKKRVFAKALADNLGL